MLGYASVIIEDFNRADEDAWLVGLSWNARRLGLEDLTLFAKYVEGNTPDSGRIASPDQRVFDITVDYYFSNTVASGLGCACAALFWIRKVRQRWTSRISGLSRTKRPPEIAGCLPVL
jgi:hypothetical protein